MASIKGRVKWFSTQKGYGFIERDDGQKDVFVHVSEVDKSSVTLNEGDRVEFDLESKQKGPAAVNIAKL